jgi:hypothetical protein
MAKTGHPNFDYTCQAYWRGQLHNFSITGNHSGTSFGQSDAQAFMEGTSSPYALTFGVLQATKIAVISSRYYDGQNSAPVFVNLYNEGNPAPTPLIPTALGYGEGGGEDYLPLEVCLDMASEVGLGKTSKPIYNRKFLRGVAADAITYDTHDEMTFALSSAGTAAVTAMGDGSWYGGRVYISPNARSANNWLASQYPGNHQVPRGRKRKSSSSQSSTIETLEKILAIAGLPVGF